MSGGGGYVISNAGFRLMVERGFQKDNCSIPEEPDDPEHSEDVETGRCLEKVGVPVISSLDSEGRDIPSVSTLQTSGGTIVKLYTQLGKEPGHYCKYLIRG